MTSYTRQIFHTEISPFQQQQKSAFLRQKNDYKRFPENANSINDVRLRQKLVWLND
jgi:hypothetical protein